MLPVLLDLLEQLDEGGGSGAIAALATSRRATWALRVSDTHHVTIPIERLRVLLRVVGELYQGDHRADPTFPAIRAGVLVDLDVAFGGVGGGLRWTDRGRVVARERVRRAPAPPVETPAGLRATLRPYQSEGVAFLQRLRESGTGGILADEMGLGKTLQTIPRISASSARAAVSTRRRWWSPRPRWSATGRARSRSSRLTSRSSCSMAPSGAPDGVKSRGRTSSSPRTPFWCATRTDSPSSRSVWSSSTKRRRSRTRAARPVARSRVCEPTRASASPEPRSRNHLGELWSILDWLAPGLLGDELAFRRFWRQPIEGRGDGERLAALRELVAPLVLRRLKRDVARELPPKTDLSVPVELGDTQRELYEAIRVAAHADVRRAIRSKGFAASAVTILDALTKLRQVCCDPRLLALDTARAVRESAKLEKLMALLGEQLAGGHRVLVFSQFTSMLALVAEALQARDVRYLLLTGATRERQRVVDAFEGGRADVFLISLKAGGTGLNLTSADTVVHYESVVESRRTGAGDRPRISHRAAAPRLRPQSVRRRKRRGARARAAAKEAMAVDGSARRRSVVGSPQRGRGRRAVRSPRGLSGLASQRLCGPRRQSHPPQRSRPAAPAPGQPPAAMMQS